MISNIGADFSDDEDAKKTDTKLRDKKRNGYIYDKNKNTKNPDFDDQKKVSNGVGIATKTPSKNQSKNHVQSKLHKATREGLISVVKSVILDDGTLINSLDENGFCPLHIAAQYNRVQILSTLLDSGAVCHTYSVPDGVTPLHVASR